VRTKIDEIPEQIFFRDTAYFHLLIIVAAFSAPYLYRQLFLRTASVRWFSGLIGW